MARKKTETNKIEEVKPKKVAKKAAKKAAKKVAKKAAPKKVEKTPAKSELVPKKRDIVDLVENFDNIDEEQLELEADSAEEVDMHIEFDDDGLESGDELQEGAPAFDFFEEVFRRARSRGVTPVYYVKKDGQLLGKFNHPCSWDKLQKIHGGGFYNVDAREIGTGKFIKSATEIIAEIEQRDQGRESEQPSHSTGAPNTLDLLAMMNKFQEQSETKAAMSAANQTNNLATMMQLIVSSQNESSKQMQLMIMEMNKQAQAQAQSQQNLLTTLLTTLMTQKPAENKSDFNALSVLKMIQDAEKNAETRTKSWFELVEKKAEMLAEEKAAAFSRDDGEGEESLTKTVIKGFIPLISQFAQNQGQVQQTQQLNHQEQQQRQMIEAARQHRERQLAMPPDVTPGVSPRPGVPQSFAPGAAATAAGPAVPVEKAGPLNRNNVVKIKETNKIANLTEDNKVTDNANMELKAQIIDLVKGDIAQGFLLNRQAAKVAEHCLKKLEKRGIMRQTVAQAFSLNEFFNLAQQYGVLEKAKPWITEFYETLAKETPESAKPNNGNESHATSPQ